MAACALSHGETELLSGTELTQFRAEVCPAAAPYPAAPRNTERVAAGARCGGAPVGLAVSEIVRAGSAPVARLRSLAVSETHRNSGVGATLLRAIETELRARSCSDVSVVVIGNSRPRTLERRIAGAGWPVLELRGLLCETTVDMLRQARWLSYGKLPPGSQVFPWTALTPGEREDLEQRRSVESWHPKLDPFASEDRIDPETSLGLRMGNRVEGWCLFHRIAPGRTACAALYVGESLQGRGYGVALAARAIRRHGSRLEHRIVFDVAFDNALMMSFLRRGLMPHLTSARLIRSSTKCFGGRTPAIEVRA